MSSFRSVAAGLLVLVVAAACSSTEVSDRQRYEGEKLPRPDRIIVHDFSADPADVPANSSFALDENIGSVTPTPEQMEVADEAGAAIAERVVLKLREAGLPAVRAAGQPEPQIEDIVVKGYFLSVEEGDATQRILVGFGAGDAKIISAVEGYQMTPGGLRLLGSGTVQTGGDELPGMVLPVAVLAATANPIGLVVGGTVKAVGEVEGTGTVDAVAEDTAEEISQELLEAAERQGWI